MRNLSDIIKEVLVHKHATKDTKIGKTYDIYISKYKELKDDVPMLRLHSLEDVDELIQDKMQCELTKTKIKSLMSNNKLTSKEINFDNTIIALEFDNDYKEKDYSWTDNVDGYKVIDTITAEQFSEKYFKKMGYNSYK